MRDRPSVADSAITALHTAPVASSALTGAITDVCRIGYCVAGVDQSHIDRLCAIADACEGMGPDELAEIYGTAHAEAATAVVGSFFGRLGKIAKGAARGIAHTALPMAASFVPGGSAALRAGQGLLRGHRRQPHPGPVPQQPTHTSPARGAPGDVPFAAVEQGAGRTQIIHIHGHR